MKIFYSIVMAVILVVLVSGCSKNPLLSYIPEIAPAGETGTAANLFTTLTPPASTSTSTSTFTVSAGSNPTFVWAYSGFNDHKIVSIHIKNSITSETFWDPDGFNVTYRSIAYGSNYPALNDSTGTPYLNGSKTTAKSLTTGQYSVEIIASTLPLVTSSGGWITFTPSYPVGIGKVVLIVE